MDFIWNLIDQIQKNAFFMALQRLAVIDWVVIFVLLWGALQGSRKGVTIMLGKTVELLLVIILVLGFYPGIAVSLTQLISGLPQSVADPMAFIILCAFFWVSIAWCFNLLGKLMRFEISGSLKPLGGLLLGGLYFFLLLSFISQFLLFFSVDAVQKSYRKGGSYSGPALVRTARDIQQTVFLIGKTKVSKADKA